MTFPYKTFPSGVSRPVVQVTLWAGSNKIVEQCLIDSGADHCLMDINIAKELKLFLKSGKKVEFSGIGKGTGFVHRIELEFEGTRYPVTVVFTSLKHLGVSILGQQGFFDHFDICFNARKQQVMVSSL